MAGPLGQMLRCRVTAGEVTDMPERSAARGGVDIDLLQGGPVVRIRFPPAVSPFQRSAADLKAISDPIVVVRAR